MKIFKIFVVGIFLGLSSCILMITSFLVLLIFGFYLIFGCMNRKHVINLLFKPLPRHLSWS